MATELLAKATRVQPVTGSPSFSFVEIRLCNSQCLKIVLVRVDIVTVVYKEGLLHNVFFVIIRVSSCKLQYTIISRIFFLRLMAVTLDSMVNIFEYQILKEGSVKIINDGMANVFVNGLPNESISNKIIPNRIENHTNAELQKIEHPDFSYIKIETNSYIGNPN